MRLLLPDDMMQHGIKLLGFSYDSVMKMSPAKQEKVFRSHYGSSPLVVAHVWYDLTTTDIASSKLNDSEKTEEGLKRFFVAMYFLFTYPKNAHIIATVFHQNEKYSRGEAVWQWVHKIQGLKAKVIIWPQSHDDPNREVYVVTVDGVDMKTWEPMHETFPHDRQFFSKKFAHGGLKYELAVSVFWGRLVWINGPYKAGCHDLTIFRNGLKDRLADGKMAIADRGYVSSREDEVHKLATPRATDSTELAKFKSRCRCRHETFNGRIKNPRILSDTYRHSLDNHQAAFEAVCVLVQYQIMNGSTLFNI